MGKSTIIKTLSLFCLWCLPVCVICPGGNTPEYLATIYHLCTRPHYSEVIPRLYLGNAKTAHDHSLLERLEITHILTIDSIPIPKGTIDHSRIKTLYIRAYDSVDTNILPYFPVANQFISDGIQKGAILVHCRFGVSRSASLVAAYLMERNGWTRDQAIRLIRSRRKIINPNPGFMAQLQYYEDMNYKIPFGQRMRANVMVKALNFKYKIASIAAAIVVTLIIPITLVCV